MLRLHLTSRDKDIRRLILDEMRRLDLDIESREVKRAHRTGKHTLTEKGFIIPMLLYDSQTGILGIVSTRPGETLGCM